jgi:hypothetical protein
LRRRINLQQRSVPRLFGSVLRLVRDRAPCACDPTGVWMCTLLPPSTIGDCFFDPPLDCDLAQSLYEDATCQTHPPCSASPPP